MSWWCFDHLYALSPLAGALSAHKQAASADRLVFSPGNSNLAVTINPRRDFPRVTREARGEEPRPWTARNLFKSASEVVGIFWSGLNVFVCCLLKLRRSAALNLSELVDFCRIQLCQTVTLYPTPPLRVKNELLSLSHSYCNSLGWRLNQHSFCLLLSECSPNLAQGWGWVSIPAPAHMGRADHP